MICMFYFMDFRMSDFTARGKYPHRGKVHMKRFCPSQTNLVWYNVRIPYTRDESIFDIGPVTRDERRLEFSLPSYRPEATGRARSPSAPPPATSGTRNSVLGLVAKPLTFPNEKPNTMVRRVSFTRRTLFSCFSLRFLEAPATRQNSEGAPLSFFPRQGGGTW